MRLATYSPLPSGTPRPGLVTADKRVIDIPEPFAKGYFALMPIHERLRGEDFSTLRSYLRVTLCNIHDEFTKRIDPPSVVQSLRATAP